MTEENLNNILSHVVNKTFPRLAPSDQNLIVEVTGDIVRTIECTNNMMSTSEQMYDQWVSCDFQDLKAIVNMTLPFIDEATNSFDGKVHSQNWRQKTLHSLFHKSNGLVTDVTTVVSPAVSPSDDSNVATVSAISSHEYTFSNKYVI